MTRSIRKIYGLKGWRLRLNNRNEWRCLKKWQNWLKVWPQRVNRTKVIEVESKNAKRRNQHQYFRNCCALTGLNNLLYSSCCWTGLWSKSWRRRSGCRRQGCWDLHIDAQKKTQCPLPLRHKSLGRQNPPLKTNIPAGRWIERCFNEATMFTSRPSSSYWAEALKAAGPNTTNHRPQDTNVSPSLSACPLSQNGDINFLQPVCYGPVVPDVPPASCNAPARWSHCSWLQRNDLHLWSQPSSAIKLTSREGRHFHIRK